MNKAWSKPVVLALDGPGRYVTITNAIEASWALIEDWPIEEGAALDRALKICSAVAEGKKSAEEARRAFVFAAAEAGIHVRD